MQPTSILMPPLAAILILGAALPAAAFETERFEARGVTVEGVVGGLEVSVWSETEIEVSATGDAMALKDLSARIAGDRLIVTYAGTARSYRWDNLWGMMGTDADDAPEVRVRVSVPAGTAIAVEEHIGDLAIGDIAAAFSLEGVSVRGAIGAVTDAAIELAGSGDLTMTSVSGTLDADIAGSGSLTAGNTGRVTLDMAGAGSFKADAIAGGLDADIAGSGEIEAGSVAGPVDIDIAGSGDVKIGGGTADPFKVSIAGSGSVVFDGEAVDPQISAWGSGTVKIRSYRGTLKSDGMANVEIGGS